MSKTVEVYVSVIQQGESAVLVTPDDGTVEGWVPHSLIGDDSEITEDSEPHDEGILEMPIWKAEDLRFL